MPCFAMVFGIIVKCSEITECGKSEQDLASYYCGSVVKLVVKWDGLTTKDFIKVLFYKTFSSP